MESSKEFCSVVVKDPEAHRTQKIEKQPPAIGGRQSVRVGVRIVVHPMFDSVVIIILSKGTRILAIRQRLSPSEPWLGVSNRINNARIPVQLCHSDPGFHPYPPCIADIFLKVERVGFAGPQR